MSNYSRRRPIDIRPGFVDALAALLMVVVFVEMAHRKSSYLGFVSSIACMTALVTKREMCSSASA